jgi:hypothetical protein
MVLLGDLPKSKFPNIDGYNLSYLRPGATVGVLTDDEYHAPVLSFWHQGLGTHRRSDDGSGWRYSRSLNLWPDFGRSLWVWAVVLGGDPPEGIRATVERQGGEGIIRVELDPERKRGGAEDIRSATAAIWRPRCRLAQQRIALSWTGEDTLEGKIPDSEDWDLPGAVDLGNKKVMPLSPLTLPYSPEFEPRQDPG